jgi:L-lysine 2,3-aminomutase
MPTTASTLMLAERTCVASSVFVAVTDARPGATPVTTPVAETVATVASLLSQVTGTAVPLRLAVSVVDVP